MVNIFKEKVKRYEQEKKNEITDNTLSSQITPETTNVTLTDSNTLNLIQESIEVLPSVDEQVIIVKRELLSQHGKIYWKPFVNYAQAQMAKVTGIDQRMISNIILKLERQKEYFRVTDKKWNQNRGRFDAISYIYFETALEGIRLWELYCENPDLYPVDNPEKLYKWWKKRIETLSDGNQSISKPKGKRIGFRRDQ